MPLHFELKSPISGVIVPIYKIPDPLFSQESMGKGISIDPTSQILVSPCSGTVVQLHSAHHALTIQTEDGIEILIHIGIDSVQMKGRGFHPLIKIGDQVNVQTPLIKFDADLVAHEATSLLTQIIILNSELLSNIKIYSGVVKAGDDLVMSFDLTEKQFPNKTRRKAETLLNSQLKSMSVKIINPTGFHARPIAKIVSRSKQYQSEIFFEKNDIKADAKSIVSLLNLDVKQGDIINIITHGEDSELALKDLHEVTGQILDSDNGKQEKLELKPQPFLNIEQTLQKVDSEGIYYGVSASPGLTFGTIFHLQHNEIVVPESSQSPYEERKMLEHALEQAKVHLKTLETSFKNKNLISKAAIFNAHEEILSDPYILSKVDQQISEGKSAAQAWKTTLFNEAQKLSSLNNELLAARATDLRDVGVRVLQLLVGQENKIQTTIPQDAILIAEDLTPSDAAQFQTSPIRGFCTITGSATSHVAILARSLGIPALAAINTSILELNNGIPVLLDGTNGFLKTHPTQNEIFEITKNHKKQEQEQKENLTHCQEISKTLDGITIHVLANISGVLEAEKASELGADGIGLLRSEFLFLQKRVAPTEEEQYECYFKIAQHFGKEKPLIFRTLDVGGDKPLPYLPIPKEENPFLGERGIRVGLDQPEILKTQIRALLKVSTHHPLQIMFPMVTRIEEIILLRQIILEESKKLSIQKTIPIGIMIEVPSSALLSDKFANYVDFFSIGTNDLTQYALAIDRGHPKLAPQVDGLHPAVLRLIQMTCKAAEKADKAVGVCGGIASDPVALPILMGLGIKEVSVSTPMIPKIKSYIRKLRIEKCQQLAHQALELETASEVRKLVLSILPFSPE